MLELLFFLIGSSWILSFLLSLGTAILALTSRLSLHKYGKCWAVITGSTGGIGLGFAEELASEGFNIVQISRDPFKLYSISTDLKSKFGVEVLNIPIDLTKVTSDPISAYQSIFDQCKHLDIGIIINNIGIYAGPLLGEERNIYLQNSANLWPIVLMTRMFLPMLEKRVQGGGIINLSSFSAIKDIALPGAEIYMAGKAFDQCFSNCIAAEVSSKVDVLCLMPSWVETPGTESCKDFRKFLLTKNQCARAALTQLGEVKCTHGHWLHWCALVHDKFFAMFRF